MLVVMRRSSPRHQGQRCWSPTAIGAAGGDAYHPQPGSARTGLHAARRCAEGGDSSATAGVRSAALKGVLDRKMRAKTIAPSRGAHSAHGAEVAWPIAIATAGLRMPLV